MKNVLLAILVCLFSYAAGAQCQAGFTHSASGLNVSFTNTSTPTTVPSTQFLIKTINFGDGSGWNSFYSSTNNWYPSSGTYSVIVSIKVMDSLTQTVVCQDNDTQQVTVTGPPCAVSFSTVQNGSTVIFTANNINSTPGMSYSWNFGDGNTGTGSPVTHTYASAGYYHVVLVGSSTTANCSSSDSDLVIIVQNTITGTIQADSNSMDTFKVWLITYDSSSQMLAAIDSTIVSNGFTQVPNYAFYNKPAGQYRTKAAQLDGPTTGTGYIPTYHNTSLYWNTATIINHSGGNTTSKHIYMQLGTVTSGPGFVGGNVTMGANKGTAAGDPVVGMLIFLRDNASNAIKHTYTDANGDYSFNNLPTGLYSIYPEEAGYTTTSAPVILTPNQVSSKGVNFVKSDSKQTVTPKSTGISNTVANALFSVSPNPSNGIITINWATGTKGSADVTVTDISGRKVYQSEVNTGSKTQLNLAQLQGGMYFISVEANGQTATKQVVIQK